MIWAVLVILILGSWFITKKIWMPLLQLGIGFLFLWGFNNHFSEICFNLFNVSVLLFSFGLLHIIYFFKQRKTFIRWKKFLYYFSFLLILAFSIETVVFNYHHFFSRQNEEKVWDKIEYVGLEKDGKNYKVVSDKEVKIVLNDINEEVNSIFFNVDLVMRDRISDVLISAIDEGYKNNQKFGNRNFDDNILKSKYINIHTYGKAKTITFDLSAVSGEKAYDIHSIVVNARIPYFFLVGRFLFIFSIILIAFLLRPSSSFYQYKLFNKLKYKTWIFFTYVLLMAALFLFVLNLNPYCQNKPLDSYKSYPLLVEAFLNGKTSIDIEIPEYIKNMDNPYDNLSRRAAATEAGKDPMTLWDMAYYDGQIYVYFGAVPAIMIYLPFYVIFGTHIPDWVAMFIFCILTVGAILFFVYQLCKKYFKKTSMITYLLVSTLLIFSSSLIDLAKVPVIYNFPIISALFFAFLGLGLWIMASNHTKVKKIPLALGSLCIALIAGCRPQFLVSMFFAFFIFYPNYRKNKKFIFSWKTFLAFFLPFVIIGLLAMYYNYIRFDSIFDFGANYNLTTNDMIHRGFSFDRFLSGIYYYLFLTPCVNPVFPFYQYQMINVNYFGVIIDEITIGGLFLIRPIVLLGLFLYKWKDKIKQKELYWWGYTAISFAIVIMLLDIQMAGLLPRYLNDFTWLFLLPVVFIILMNDNQSDGKNKRNLQKIIFVLLIFTFIFEFFNMFKYDTDLSLANTKVYNYLYYWFHS